MELLSNSLAAYAHIRGEGRAWENGAGFRTQAALHSQLLSPTPRYLSPAALLFCAPNLGPGSLPDGPTPACQAPL